MISVIIPCFNYSHLIGDTINSIQRQTYSDWEIIIVDDGSTDNTAKIVEQYTNTNKQIYFYQQSNAGPSAARNFALTKAQGEFIQFLDADDLLEDRKFEIQLAAFREKPFADIVYGSVRYFHGNPENKNEWLYSYWGVDKEWMPGFSGRGNEILAAALKGSFAHISSFLFRRSIIEKAGKWDVRKRAAEDYLFVLKCVLVNGFFLFHNVPGSYALVRWHDKNASRNKKWIHEEEKKMRVELAPIIEQTGNKEAVFANNNALNVLTVLIKENWRKKFLSGGRFDFLKKIIHAIGLEKLAKRIFYK